MVREWLGPWSPHPNYAEMNLLRWRRWGLCVAILFPLLWLAVCLAVQLSRLLNDPLDALLHPITHAEAFREAFLAALQATRWTLWVLLFAAPLGVAFSLTASLNNFVADHVTQTRGADVAETPRAQRIFTGASNGMLLPLVSGGILGIGLIVLAFVTLQTRTPDWLGMPILVLSLVAYPVLLEVASAKRAGIPPTWWMAAGVVWAGLSLAAGLKLLAWMGSQLAWPVCLMLILWIVSWCLRALHGWLRRSSAGEQDDLEPMHPEALRALPAVPVLPGAPSTQSAPQQPRPPAALGGAPTAQSQVSGIDDPIGVWAKDRSEGLRLGPQSDCTVPATEDATLSDFVQDSHARSLFWSLPTRHQLRALDGIRSMRDKPAQADDDRGRDVIIEGPVGSGRTTTLVAAAIDAVLGGHDVLFVVADRARAEAAIDEFTLLIERHALKGFLRADRLRSDSLKPINALGTMSRVDSHGVLPEILVASVRDIESNLFGGPSHIPTASIRRAVCTRDVLLIDDLIEMPDSDRAHLAFVLDKLRLLMRMQAIEPQVVLSCPPLARRARITLAVRLLSAKGEPNRFELFPAAEKFKATQFAPLSDGYPQSEVLLWSEAAAASLAKAVVGAGRKVVIVLPGRPHSHCESISASLGGTHRNVPVVSGFDGLRVHRDIVKAWAGLQSACRGAAAIVAIAPAGLDAPAEVVVFRAGTSPTLSPGLHVLPILPSALSWTFLARHLRSLAPLLPLEFPLHRDHWARLGLGPAGSLANLPTPAAGTFAHDLEILLDPCEFDQSAIEVLDEAFWPWACMEQAPASRDRQPVDLDAPPSFVETLRLDSSGTRLLVGRMLKSDPTTVARRSSQREPPLPGEEPRSESGVPPEIIRGVHRLRWFNDQGRQLGNDGLTDLAYAEDLLYRSGTDVYFAQKIEGPDPRTGELRVTAQPSVGARGETQNPIWRGLLHLPTADPTMIARSLGGPLGATALRFDLRGCPRRDPDADPRIEQRRRRRQTKEAAAALGNAPRLALELLEALDTAGTASRLDAAIQFEHAVRGTAWSLLNGSMDRDAYKRVDAAAERGLGGAWSTATTVDDHRPGGSTERAAWCGDVWPELSAALQIGLRKTLPGWQHFGRVVAFFPSAEASALGVSATVFFVEPIPTEETVTDAIHVLAQDPAMLGELLEQCLAELRCAGGRPIELSLRARTNWERPAEAHGAAKAADVLEVLLNAIQEHGSPLHRRPT